MLHAHYRRASRAIASLALASMVFVAPAAVDAQAVKKPLDHDAYDIWNRITGQSITDDGRWMLYHVVSEANDPVLHVKSVAGDRAFTVERAEGATFSDDGRFVVFTIKPGKAAVKQAEKDSVKAADMPQDSLGILDLNGGTVVFRTERVRNFAVPAENGEWLAYQLLKPPGADSTAEQGRAGGGAGRAGGRGGRAGGAGGRGGQGSNARKTDGFTLVVRNLRSGAEQRIEMVTDYEFTEDGSRLVYVTQTEDGSNDGVHVRATAAGTTTTLLAGKGRYTNVELDEAGRQVAFLSNRDDPDADQSEYKLYHWNGQAAGASAVAAASMTGVPQGWWVSENRGPTFSQDGSRLFFGTAPRPAPEPEPDPDAEEEEPVTVDVWAWTDPLLQPMQLIQVDQERRRNYQAVVHLDDQARIVQLATLDMPEVVLGDEGNADIALGRSDLPYRQEISWGESGDDLFLVDLNTGRHELIVQHARGQNQLSPDAKYLAMWDGENLNWNVMDLATRKVVNVSAQIPYPVHDELHDSPSNPGSEGSAGWTEGDARFLVYDRYDVWAVDPAGVAAPRNVTEGVGRRENVRFRYVRLDNEERQIGASQPIMLSAFHYTNKQSGFYRDRMNGNTPPVRLIMEDMRLGGGFGGGLDKAEDADVLMYARGSFEQFPDLYVSGSDFANVKRMSDANPQQAEYSWGTSELYEWRSALDGQVLQGVLYKPENFDPSRQYPMMVYFYERLSDNLHNYVAPTAGSSSINISFYVSRGYLVFTPDIPYEVGYPGESALKAVVPGVLSLIDEGFVDKDAIGVQGHSWGGYQIAYLVTKTNVFKAAEAGAPVANMISAYGGIRWGSGMSRMFQYEKTQSRIGGTLWEAPVHYIENSPIFWADKVETPLLMMHNDQDGAVPWYQGIEYFVALRRLSKPVWLFNYNGEDHGLRQERNRKDWTIRMQQFFDHYLKGDPMPVWMSEGVPAILKGKTLGLELVTAKEISNEQGGTSKQ